MTRRAAIRKWLQDYGWWLDWRRFWGQHDPGATVTISVKDYQDLGNELLHVSHGLFLTKQEVLHLTRARVSQRVSLAYTKINDLLERHPAFRHLEGFDSSYFDDREHQEPERPISAVPIHRPSRHRRTA